MQVVQIPYCGNKCYIDDDAKHALLQQSITLAGDVATATKNYDSVQWKNLKEMVGDIAQRVSTKDQFLMEDYKFQILSGAVLPYVRIMTTRIKLEPRRFQQITKLLKLLCSDTQGNVSTTTPTSLQHHYHPAAVLLLLDEEVRRINSEAGWWQSELGSSLQSAVELQWLPILQDHRYLFLTACIAIYIATIVITLLHEEHEGYHHLSIHTTSQHVICIYASGKGFNE
jgi:hypothetical protein